MREPIPAAEFEQLQVEDDSRLWIVGLALAALSGFAMGVGLMLAVAAL
jgi:hypothetical protein